MLYSEIEKIKIQNYACRGCPNCSQLKTLDLRTRQGIFTYLIKKRSCYLNRIQDKISKLQVKETAVKKEIEEYQEQLEQEARAN
jgi:response regulator of citrate/malate metabolism